MDQLPALGRSLENVMGPTFQIYAPLLQQNTQTIKSVTRETFAYGPYDRQQLDIYHAPHPRIVNGRRPILLFEYGGGLVRGGKSLPIFPDDLVYANVGAFFALECGYTVVIADYRLLSHGAKFPSGGEDIALAVEWIATNQVGQGSEPIDLYIMGNSAGGIHLTTFLLHPDFAETRRKVVNGDGTRLRGLVLLSVPFHFAHAPESRGPVLETYFGDHEAHAPLGLLKTARREQKIPLDFVQGGARLLVMDAELDSEDEIRRPGKDFITEWLAMDDNESRSALAVDSMTGHNHISPVLGLSTGIAKEEAWGHQVAGFCENIRKFKPSTG
ncbi:hypothetical protein B0A55_01471 [Friedmanniomyces simplex]|uniref:BD-FAE-like domain-containing protein n=1 Tax=Friedmanniomyces simplex TaxID=329884 RepID=A0A4U0Y045_9PEZI|nr:hypothetical protein B0A55_01471 [Friedmanniomyces simplex]